MSRSRRLLVADPNAGKPQGEAQRRPSLLLLSELLRTSEPPSALLSSRAGGSQNEVQQYI